jgi:hypothetical protein
LRNATTEFTADRSNKWIYATAHRAVYSVPHVHLEAYRGFSIGIQISHTSSVGFPLSIASDVQFFLMFWVYLQDDAGWFYHGLMLAGMLKPSPRIAR